MDGNFQLRRRADKKKSFSNASATATAPPIYTFTVSSSSSPASASTTTTATPITPSATITPTDNLFFPAKSEKSLWGSIEEVSKYDYPDKVDRSEPVRINIFFILLIAYLTD
jgi:hypothetical protein